MYTIIGIIALVLIGSLSQNGMNMWESLNHAMTAIATGGFSVTDDSIIGFGAVSQIAIIVLMVFGGIAFAAHYDLLKGRIKRFLSDTQFQAMILILFLGIIILTFINLNDPTQLYNNNILLSLKESGFQFISALTCTGFASANIPSWTESAKLILSFARLLEGLQGQQQEVSNSFEQSFSVKVPHGG